MKSADFADIFETLESFPKKIQEDKNLIQIADIPKYKVKNRYINFKRQEKRKLIEEEMEKLYFLKDEYKGTY